MIRAAWSEQLYVNYFWFLVAFLYNFLHTKLKIICSHKIQASFSSFFQGWELILLLLSLATCRAFRFISSALKLWMKSWMSQMFLSANLNSSNSSLFSPLSNCSSLEYLNIFELSEPISCVEQLRAERTGFPTLYFSGTSYSTGLYLELDTPSGALETRQVSRNQVT